MEFYEKKLDEIYGEFATSADRGLSENGVTTSREKYGANTLKTEGRDPWYKVLGRQFTGMLIYILLGAAIISGFLAGVSGEASEWIDTVAIIVILVVNGVLGFIQEWKAQASIEALKKMAQSKATVIRNGQQQSVEATDLVPGDILVLQTGDKIPADARIIEESNLETQEGALTGESVPVTKDANSLSGELPLGDQKNMLFSGTIITKGRGKAVVTSTGMKTEIGKIAHMIQQTEVEQTPLQRNLEKLGSKLGKITIAICVVIFFFILFSAFDGFTLEALKEPLLLAVALAVAAIPEGLPIVVTIALAFGTQIMVKKNALIKRLSSVETLGSTDVICSDKTGTLTKNEMTVKKLWFGDHVIEVEGTGYSPVGKIEGEVNEILFGIGALCNDGELVEKDNEYSVLGDPTEGCLLTLARKASYDEHELRNQHPRIGEIPFDSERKRMSTINTYGDEQLILTKGAPDIILNHCSHIQIGDDVIGLTEEEKKKILDTNETFAKDALRVLGFAYKHIDKRDKYTVDDENDLIFVGLTGMIDPPRPEVIPAIERCEKAGIKVVMITGDHITTATAIAHEIGIEGEAILGADIEHMNLDEKVDEISIYARVNPEHKMAIVDALKKKGHIVAMTGDGVNDAPALKKADIGIAMGITGTDVAKESASMILTDDNFTSIVNAVEEGRNIYTNIKKFVNYLLSSNLGEVLTIFLAIMLFKHNGHIVWPLTATMILYMNLLTDSLPALALGVDPGDKHAMEKKPRPASERIINKNMLVNIIIIGSLVAIATLITFKWSLNTTGDLAHAQTMALTTLVVLELVRLSMIRSQYSTPFFSNKWLFMAIGFVMLLQLAVIYTPFMQIVFKTVALSSMDWGVIAITGVITYVVGMIVGAIVRKTTGLSD